MQKQGKSVPYLTAQRNRAIWLLNKTHFRPKALISRDLGLDKTSIHRIINQEDIRVRTELSEKGEALSQEEK